MTFGMIAKEFAGSPEHYVSDEDVLFDWLIADNYTPSEQNSRLMVPAPEGYVFWNDNLILKTSPKLVHVDNSELSESATVTIGSPENDKALMLIEEAVSYVKRATFYGIGIADDRIREFFIY